MTSSFLTGLTLASRVMSYNSTNIIFSPYGNYWRELRKICITELLTPKRVQSFRKIREEEVSSLMRTISLNARAPFNLNDIIFSSTYGITLRAAFGEKCKDQEAFISVVKRLVMFAGGFSIADMYPSVKLLAIVTGMGPKLEKLHQEADRILENIVNEHKESLASRKIGQGEVKEDLVDVLLRVQKSGELEFPLTDDTIKAVILKLLELKILSCECYVRRLFN